MVSFNCDACNDVVKKPKLDQHYHQRCGASFTCLDCSSTFYQPLQWKDHTTCISEKDKYEGSKAKKRDIAMDVHKGHLSKASLDPAEPTFRSNTGVTTTEPSIASPNKRKRSETKISPPVKIQSTQEEPSSVDKITLQTEPPSGTVSPSERASLKQEFRELQRHAKSQRSSTLKRMIELVAEKRGASSKQVRKEVLKKLMVSTDGDILWT